MNVFYSRLDHRRSRKRRSEARQKKMEGRFIIMEVGPDGEPIAPEATALKFIRQSGCIVRDHVPISFRLWKASNPSEERDAVPEREKEWCWRELKKNFTVPAESEESAKRWTLTKMAEQFQTFKKNLTKNYIRKGKHLSSLETLQSRRTTGMPLWILSL